MRQSLRPLEASFVIRLWLERSDLTGEARWRLRARHVQSGEEIYCRSVANLLAFVERQSGVAAPRLAASGERETKSEEE